MQDLFKNYEMQMKDYESLNKSKIWSQVISNSFKDINSDKLKNFFSNDLSNGIDNSRLFQKKIVKEYFLNLCNKYKKSNILKLFVDENNNIGNSQNHYSYQGKIVTHNSIILIDFYLEIEKYFLNKKNIILEIGGGYGGLARIISSNKNCTYVLIDLPEINLISSYYLKSHFPNKKFLFYERYKTNKEVKIKNYDFVILPPWSLDRNIPFDFCINTKSMMEMDAASINKYFKYIQVNLKEDGYFLNVNRYFSSDNNYNFYFYKFPYDKKWKIIESKTSWLRKNIHFLLTQRTKENFDEIEDIFKKLKVFTENRMKYKKNIYYKIKTFIKGLFKRIRLKSIVS